MSLGQILETMDQVSGQVRVTGEIRTYALDMKLDIRPNGDRRSDSSPSHVVWAKGRHGNHFQAGVAWQGKTREGKGFYSIQLEIPELNCDMSLVAFERRAGTYDISFSRTKEDTQQSTAPQAA